MNVFMNTHEQMINCITSNNESTEKCEKRKIVCVLPANGFCHSFYELHLKMSKLMNVFIDFVHEQMYEQNTTFVHPFVHEQMDESWNIDLYHIFDQGIPELSI